MNGPQVTFFGRLTQDPGELRFTQNAGTPYITAGVAVNTYRSADDEVETHYFNVTLWGRNAENLLNRCRKGQEVFVQGQYSFREYTRRDGTKGHSHDVNSREFHHYQERAQPRETENEDDTEEATAPAANSPVGTVEPAAPAGPAPTTAQAASAGPAPTTAQAEPASPAGLAEPLADPFGEETGEY